MRETHTESDLGPGRGDTVELHINILTAELTHQKRERGGKKEEEEEEEECPAIPESSKIHACIIAAMNIHIKMNI